MGINGLIPFLAKAQTGINLPDLKGSACAVDAYGWLHRATITCAVDLYYKNETIAYVDWCMKQVDYLINIGIKPILVFDGRDLPAKDTTNATRRGLKAERKERVEKLLKQNKKREANDLMKQCVDVTHDMAYQLILKLRDAGVDYIVAPYEADAQMAYLVRQKFVDFVLTEDTDLIVYGCEYIVFKYRKVQDSEVAMLFESSKLPECLGPKSLKSDFEKFRRMCIMSGCDYLKNLPGIGLKKAETFFGLIDSTNLARVLKRIPSYLNMKKVTVDDEYVSSFIAADKTFLHQLVFCPRTRKLVPLNPHETGTLDFDLRLAGERFDDETAFKLAIGRIDLDFNPLDDYEPDFTVETSMWNPNFKLTDEKMFLEIVTLAKCNEVYVPSSGDSIVSGKRCSQSSQASQSSKKSRSNSQGTPTMRLSEDDFASSSQLSSSSNQCDTPNTNFVTGESLLSLNSCGKSENSTESSQISSSSDPSSPLQTSDHLSNNRNIFKVHGNGKRRSKYFTTNTLEVSHEIENDIEISKRNETHIGGIQLLCSMANQFAKAEELKTPLNGHNVQVQNEEIDDEPIPESRRNLRNRLAKFRCYQK